MSYESTIGLSVIEGDTIYITPINLSHYQFKKNPTRKIFFVNIVSHFGVNPHTHTNGLTLSRKQKTDTDALKNIILFIKGGLLLALLSLEYN